jgi:hypothetical protein
VKVAVPRVHAKVAVHAKSVTAVAVMAATQRAATPKAKLATSAWHAKIVAKQQKAATTHANLAVNVQSAANVARAKAVANAAHVANATKVAANVPHVRTKTATQKHCLWTTRLAQKAKHRRPTRTVASVVSAVHVTVTAGTAASVATALRVKKVQQNMPTTARLLCTITDQTNKARKRPANIVSHAKCVNLAVNVKSVANATRHVKMRTKLKRQRLPALACLGCKRSPCLWPTCNP